MTDKTEPKQDKQPDVFDYTGFEGKGLEFAPPEPIPRLKIVHGNNPDLSRKDSPLHGAAPGVIYYTKSLKYKSEWQVIPCKVSRLYTEFPKDIEESGFPISIRVKRPTDVQWVDGEGLINRAGNRIVENRSFYCLLIDGGKPLLPAVIDMNKTSISTSNDWLALMRIPLERPAGTVYYIPPIFSRIFTLRTSFVDGVKFPYHKWEVDPNPSWNDPKSQMFNDAIAFEEKAAETVDQYGLSVDPQLNAVLADDGMPF